MGPRSPVGGARAPGLRRRREPTNGRGQAGFVELRGDPSSLVSGGDEMILDRFRLTDRVAIVTGGGKGIGRGIARAFAEAGADVAVAARTRSDLDETVRGIEARGRRGLAVPTDVMQTESLERLVAATLEAFGRIDLLVNNAGGTGPRPALETSERFFERALRMNVTQAFLLTRMVVPKMVETAGGGAIVNISSRSSDMVQTAFVAYAAGKAALNMITRNLAAEFAPRVRVNAISVGGVATEALDVVLTHEALREQFDANTPMKRPGTVEDVAACALYLASPAASWVTGKIFQVDGGVECPAIRVPVPPL
jgi:7-alpha-hydroxysteroid dehydrogenase